MPQSTDINIVGSALYFLPVATRVPLKFGPETLTEVICARVCLTVTGKDGRKAQGWGETPLSAQWVWPSTNTSLQERIEALKNFSIQLAELWASVQTAGHPIEIGHAFQETVLSGILTGFNQRQRRGSEPMPWLAALICCSAFDIALHDAFGKLHDVPIYNTYNAQFMNRDLGCYLSANPHSQISFRTKFPADFLVVEPAKKMFAWHLVGGLDLLEKSELTGGEPNDGYPVVLTDWIERDGLKCLKVKLRGNDFDWDYQRLVKVGSIAIAQNILWLSADFNCMVSDPNYVNEMLDRLRDEQPRIYAMILYVEQPFPYDLERNPLDVRSVSARKPLFLDESAHDWKLVRFGRELGWSGVALKTCKTQTGALLTACWVKAHGMNLMVQDLTNPMLAQIPHVLLASHVGTIMGVETNAMQFYPDASRAEAAVHPGVYQRREGRVDLSTIRGPGFGYRLVEMKRELPQPAAEFK